MELGLEDVSLSERCPHFRGWYLQASMELGPEDVLLLKRCRHLRGWYVKASIELGPHIHKCWSFKSIIVQGINAFPKIVI